MPTAEELAVSPIPDGFRCVKAVNLTVWHVDHKSWMCNVGRSEFALLELSDALTMTVARVTIDQFLQRLTTSAMDGDGILFLHLTIYDSIMCTQFTLVYSV